MKKESSSYISYIVEQAGETAHKSDVLADESIKSNMQESNAKVAGSSMQKINAKVDGSSTQQQNNVVRAKPEAKKRSCSPPQPHPSKKPKQGFQTIDYLARWNSTTNVNHKEASSSTITTSEKATTGLVPKASKDEGDDLNLELQLCSQNSNKPDLDLKLGL